jgi:hypothetical protein
MNHAIASPAILYVTDLYMNYFTGFSNYDNANMCNKWTIYFRFELEIRRKKLVNADEQCTALTNMCNLAVDFLLL